MMYADLSSCERRAESYSWAAVAVGVRIKSVSYVAVLGAFRGETEEKHRKGLEEWG